MTVFKLPDLGEGLPDAEIVKWMVKEGDTITEGNPMVEMSTAKAVVEVPAPHTGKIVKLHGGPGDVINTGNPLVTFQLEGEEAPAQELTPEHPKKTPAEEPQVKLIKEAKGDSGTVVGAVVVGDEVTSDVSRNGASAAVRAKARKLKVDLSTVIGTGPGGKITMKDVKGRVTGATPALAKPIPVAETPTDFSVSPSAKATARALDIDVGTLAPREGCKMLTKGDVLEAARSHIGGAPARSAATAKDVKAAPKVRSMASQRGVDLKTVPPTGHTGNVTMEDVLRAGAVPDSTHQAYTRPLRAYDVTGEAEKLVGPRRVMAIAMARANAEVCNTSIFDEISIVRWGEGQDITVRLMRSVISASFAEPAVNAWFDGEAGEKTIHKHINLGVAVDSPKGLFVPVIKGADAMDGPSLRAELNRLRDAIKNATIKMEEMAGGTITLSNFGMIAGRFATPIVLPPEVAIVGIGGLYEKLVMTEKGIENQRFIPVSLTFDHRACSGGEAARFLAAILNDLALAF